MSVSQYQLDLIREICTRIVINHDTKECTLVTGPYFKDLEPDYVMRFSDIYAAKTWIINEVKKREG